MTPPVEREHGADDATLAIQEALHELGEARHRLWVISVALGAGEISCAAAEVVVGDTDDALAKAIDVLRPFDTAGLQP